MIIFVQNYIDIYKRTRNRILYSQNRCENYDLDKEYTDSIKMKKSVLLFGYDETDKFEK